MLALDRSGRQADALGAYRAAPTALDALGLEPGAGLRRLERQILSEDAALERAGASCRRLAPSASRCPGRSCPRLLFAFVGREPELERLRARARTS